ncbi:LolA-related protein [Lysobacter humi (ex Lee et al. 2017)]
MLLTMLLAATGLHAAPPEAVDTGWILGKLARPAPMRTQFVELRGSRLLKKPLRVEGEYQRPSRDVLVREVRVPYAETSTIRAGSVTIARGGKAGRTYLLDRAPELAGLQAGFGALLSGDRVQLERHFRLASEGTRERWTLRLVPREARMAQHVRGLSLYGRGTELRCIETQPVKGDVQRTLLAGAAQAAAGVSDAPGLAALCRGDAR